MKTLISAMFLALFISLPVGAGGGEDCQLPADFNRPGLAFKAFEKFAVKLFLAMASPLERRYMAGRPDAGQALVTAMENTETVAETDLNSKNVSFKSESQYANGYLAEGVVHQLLHTLGAKPMPSFFTIAGLLNQSSLKGTVPCTPYALREQDYQKVLENADLFQNHGLSIIHNRGGFIEIYSNHLYSGSMEVIHNPALKALRYFARSAGIMVPVGRDIRRDSVRLLPVKRHPSEGKYVFSSYMLQTVYAQLGFPDSLFEQDFELQPYGPIQVFAPKRELLEQFMEEHYPIYREFIHVTRTLKQPAQATGFRHILADLKPPATIDQFVPVEKCRAVPLGKVALSRLVSSFEQLNMSQALSESVIEEAGDISNLKVHGTHSHLFTIPTKGTP